MSDSIKNNSLKAWLLAARPKTLSGAAVPVIIGTSFAMKDTGMIGFQWIPALLCFLFAFIMQIDANFINDYFDFKHGNDDQTTRLGPKRACSEGWITPKAMILGIIITTLVACLIGLPLILWGGLELILIGMLCVIFCFLYTTLLSYYGFGDLLVLLFFGVIPVCLTYYLELPTLMHTITWEVFFASIACGMVVDTLLVINNYRDRENDLRDHKMTLIVRLGAQKAEFLYLYLGFIASLMMIAIYAFHFFTTSNSVLSFISIALAFIYIFLHRKANMKMKSINHGVQLNQILGLTARNMFIYAITCAIGILIM